MKIEKFDLSGDGRVTLYCYLHHWTTVAGHYPQRAGVLVLPGGGYATHGTSEGEPVAQAFFAQGYDSFVLRYSVGEHAVFPAACADAGRALMLIRAHAEAWNLDPGKIAVCGFSAGGHVAACLGTMWKRADLQAACGAKGPENRPDALILGYACISADIQAQRGMFLILAGDRSLEEIQEIASAEKYVDADTPPVFLWNMQDDQLVPVEQGLRFQLALAEHDIPFEAHTYGHGIHGCGLATPVTSIGTPLRENAHVARWFTDCCLWLTELFGAPVLDCPQTDLYFPGQGRAHPGQPCVPDDFFQTLA